MLILNFFGQMTLSDDRASEQNREDDLSNISELPFRLKDRMSDYLLAYEPYIMKDTQVEETSPEQTAKAVSGQYNKIQEQNSTIELKAIWAGENKFALLKLTDLAQGSSKLMKMKQGQSILGLKLTISSQTHVELTDDTRNITLLMYKPQGKERV